MLVVRSNVGGCSQHSNPFQRKGSQGILVECWFVGLLAVPWVRFREKRGKKKEKPKNSQQTNKHTYIYLYPLRGLRFWMLAGSQQSANNQPTSQHSQGSWQAPCRLVRPSAACGLGYLPQSHRLQRLNRSGCGAAINLPALDPAKPLRHVTPRNGPLGGF